MKPSVRFWNRIARKYARDPISNETVYQQKLKETQKYFTREMEVLEFGCGTGSTALIHAPYVKAYTAIDSSEKMIEIANEKISESDATGLKFQIGSMEELDVPAQTFDMILGLNVIHLMDNPSAIISKVNRFLKPGGIFVHSTACIMEFMPWFRFIAPLGSKLSLIPHVQFFSKEELLKMHSDNGFEILYELEKEKRSQADFIIAKKIE